MRKSFCEPLEARKTVEMCFARTDVPRDAYSTAGNRGQYVIVVPSHDLVIVRRGLDYGRQGFDRWDLTREVLKAIQTTSDRQ